MTGECLSDELIDSHCHIDFPDLIDDIDAVLARMAEQSVIGAVCASVRMEELPAVLALAEAHRQIWATAGVHPDTADAREPSVHDLIKAAAHPKVLAIGETGLDYFRQSGNLEWQRERFRRHIRAAKEVAKPIVVHTREAAADTIRILREEDAKSVGGVMHCFTESIEIAEAAMELGFYISFSGIVSFKSASTLREVARGLPAERLLVETDSPYLAPVPKRGKRNEPAFVRYVAEALAELRGVSMEAVARTTTENFRRLFPGTL